MTTYTAEDFAEASRARHPNGYVAARIGYLAQRQWRISYGRWLSDAEMAADGWVPVREAGDQPITLDAIHDAWEIAEDADECNEGDILIYRHPSNRFDRVEVWKSGRSCPLGPHARILHRAPKPTRPEGAEALEALLDEWRDLPRGEEPTPLADWLAARGVRVTEGEER